LLCLSNEEGRASRSMKTSNPVAIVDRSFLQREGRDISPGPLLPHAGLPRAPIPGNRASGTRGSRKSKLVLRSAVRTAQSVSYTGLSSQEEGLPFLCLLSNSVRKRQDTSPHLNLYNGRSAEHTAAKPGRYAACGVFETAKGGSGPSLFEIVSHR